MKTVLGISILAWATALAAPAIAAPVGMQPVFDEACDLYENSEFGAARERFELLVSRGVINAAVFYNLGNCYYRLGDRGLAVANYRRAQALAPRDPEIQANLELMRSEIGLSDTTAASGLAALLDMPGRTLSAREMKSAGYAAYWLAGLGFLGMLFLRGGLRRRAAYFAAVFAVLAAVSYSLGARTAEGFRDGTSAVVIHAESELMSGPGGAFQELTRLPDGAEIHIRSRSGIWVEARMPTGEVGWVREQDIEVI
jgi:tetratricopeptide (TPR) repeat protein